MIAFTDPWRFFLLWIVSWAVIAILALLAARRHRRRSVTAASPAPSGRAPTLDPFPRGLILRTVLRLAVALLIAGAAGNPVVRGQGTERSVVLAVDLSRSISDLPRMERAVRAFKKALPGDVRVAITVFGGRSREFLPPTSAAEAPDPTGFAAAAGNIEPSRTDLAGAIRHARSLIRPGSEGHILLFTDGVENAGDALVEAALTRREGLAVHAAPVAAEGADFVLRRLIVPSRTGDGERITIESTISGTVAGEVELTVRRTGTGGGERIVGREIVRVLPDQSHRIVFADRPRGRGYVQYVAEIVSQTAEVTAENNVLRASTRLTGPDAVLVVSEDGPSLAAALAAGAGDAYRIRTVAPGQLTDPAILVPHGAVVLDNLPRKSVGPAMRASLAAYVRRGGGLLILGGPTSLGAGGWRDGEQLPAVLPVTMKPRETKRAFVVFVIDRSASMGQPHGGRPEGKIETVRQAVGTVLAAFDTRDLIAIVAFNNEAEVFVPVTPAGERDRIRAKIRAGLRAKGGTDIVRGLRKGLDVLRSRQAKVRHLVLLSDGIDRSGGAGARAARQKIVAEIDGEGMSLSSIGIGRDKNWDLLQDLRCGQGRSFPSADVRELDRIFREIVLDLKHEYVRTGAFTPRRAADHWIVGAFREKAIPPLGGRNRTAAKPRAQVLIDAGEPAPDADGPPDPILAVWRSGLGKSAVLATSAGAPWANWLRREDGAKTLLIPSLRWLLQQAKDPRLRTRVVRDEGREWVETQHRDADGRPSSHMRNLRVRISPLEDGGDRTDAENAEDGATPMEQVGLGRYRAPFPFTKPGAYRIEVREALSGGPQPVDEIAHTVAYPDELRALGLDRERIARIVEAGGGGLIEEAADLREALAARRRRPRPVRAGWTLLLLGAVVALGEYAARIRTARKRLAPPPPAA